MAADVVTIGTASCPPGSIARGLIEVARGPNGSIMGFPVLIVNGALAGPRLCLAAGIHGDEYEGMEAVRRTVLAANPATLRGALIGLPCVNPPAFEAASRSSGIDHLNLNRIFPGSAAGTLSQRWAARFVEEVIPNIDALVDLHTGGGFGEIVPLTVLQTGFEELATGLARAMGHKVLWKGGKWGGTARISTLQAGKPAVTCEIAGGGYQEETVARHTKSLQNAMRYFGLIDGQPEIPEEYQVVNGTFAYSGTGGFFRPEVAPGALVKAGDPIGRVLSHWGDEVEQCAAPTDGMVLWIRKRAAIFPGEEVVIFGEILEVIRR